MFRRVCVCVCACMCMCVTGVMQELSTNVGGTDVQRVHVCGNACGWVATNADRMRLVRIAFVAVVAVLLSALPTAHYTRLVTVTAAVAT